jgi:hypothetical protein
MDLTTLFGLFARFAPAILSGTKAAPIAPFLGTAITLAQMAHHLDGSPLTGDEKRALAVGEVQNGLKAANAQALATGNAPLAPALSDSEVGHAISLIVDTSKLVWRGLDQLHQLHPNAVTDQPAPSMPPPTSGTGKTTVQ